jgi:hypothetical protein
MQRVAFRLAEAGRFRPVLLIIGFAFALAWPLVASSSVQAAQERIRVFDPAMSLTGNCSVSTEDPVPDAGCPGGLHPEKPLTNPCGTATDSYGDVYVVSVIPGIPSTQGSIDVFNAEGEFLTEIKEEHWPCDLAVDSEGNLYALEHTGEERVLLFAPDSYPPQVGTRYSLESEAVVVHPKPPTASCGYPQSIAVDPSDDHLYMNVTCEGILEYGSAAENLPTGNWPPIGEPIGEEFVGSGDIDVYGKNHDVYAAGFDPNSADGSQPGAQRIYVFDGTTGEQKCESNGSETPPKGRFSFVFGKAAIAVDQSTGDFYVDDTRVNKAIDRFDSSCHFLDQLPSRPPVFQHPDLRAGLAVDDPCVGPGETSCDLGGYHGPDESRIYVGSGEKGEGAVHLFAFPLKEPGPPEIEAQVATGITSTEAQLSARLNPHALQTTYHFEYIRQADYEADGEIFGAGTQSVPAPEASTGNSASFVPVAEPIAGLEPSTAYRFRLTATNCGVPGAVEGSCLTKGSGNPGGEGEDATFVTYLPEVEGLPDHRGYELVTPPDTGGYVPTMNELGFSPLGSTAAFATDFAGTSGEGLLFGIEGGSLPGLPGGGFHDTYEAHREADGPYGRWRSEFNGIDGTEAREPTADGFSSDHASSFWTVRNGTVAEEGNYLLRSGGVIDPECSPEPAGDLELIGCGSLGTDARASGGWISPSADHVIFATVNENSKAQQLEPLAPPTGTAAVYDRTPDGVTHVVSLKPGDLPFAAGENASYQGASVDGAAVAFQVGETLYVRLDDQTTVEVAAGDQVFGGLSRDGSSIVFLRPNQTKPLLDGSKIPQGEIFACDVRSGPCVGPGAQAPIRIGSGNKSVLVNVSADGSHVYFAEEDNLYDWDGSGVHLITTLDPSDLIGHESVETEVSVGGLGLWVTNAVAQFPGPRRGPASDPSRTTPDGAVLVFESRADIASFDSGGHSEIYRYDSVAGTLSCLSCNPTGAAAISDAQLQPDPPLQFHSLPPVNAINSIANVSVNGRRVFFQTADQLVLGDTDGKLDVYEWESDGEGDCNRKEGCVHLISSGHSAADNYLYAMTPDGHDVFFESGDLLVPRDHEATPSIYDARVDGGEAAEETPLSPCIGEACQSVTPVPLDLTPASSSFESSGGPVKPPCHSSKDRSGPNGKVGCVHRHHKKGHRFHRKHGRAHSNQGAAR